MASDRKVVLITRRTRVEELTARFQTADQARFYVEHLGADFADYEREHGAYVAARATVEEALLKYGRMQLLDRTFLPSYLFSPDDVVVALGQDGLVANTLKYLTGQPLIGVNPERSRYDGVLLPFDPVDLGKLLPEVLAGKRRTKSVTMAKASLSDGQSLYAVNDLFIGPKSHTSAHYEIQLGDRTETQSSSGLIVTTGFGSTAWFKSVVTGSLGVAEALGIDIPREAYVPAAWDAPYLQFAVREPFPSVASQATLICGRVQQPGKLVLRSLMPENGVIFSDGIESDFLNFSAGHTAHIGVAERIGVLVQ